MKINILYGTETGNAEMLCEDIEANLAADHEVTLTNLEDATLEDLTAEGAYIFVCSTYGDGDLPASAIDFGAIIETKNRIYRR